MTECERQVELAMAPDVVLAYVADPRNLARFVPGVRAADRTWSGGVDVVADAGGQERRKEAELSGDRDRSRVDWSVEGPEAYGGHLNVLPSDSGTLIRAYVHSDRLDADRLAAAMDDVLDRLARAVEGEAVRGRTGERTPHLPTEPGDGRTTTYRTVAGRDV